VFPDRGTVYDFYFVKQASGSWNNWIDRVEKGKSVIPKEAKVKKVFLDLCTRPCDLLRI